MMLTSSGWPDLITKKAYSDMVEIVVGNVIDLTFDKARLVDRDVSTSSPAHSRKLPSGAFATRDSIRKIVLVRQLRH